MEVEIDLSEYKPTEKQDAAHMCKARYILYGGTVRSGKSVFGCEDGLHLNLMHPGNVGLIARWELSALENTTLNTYLKFTPPEAISNHNKSKGIIHHPNGSKTLYMGLKPSNMNNLLSRLGSLELGWFFLDEANEIPRDIFEFLKTRLSLRLPDGSFPRYRGILCSNPDQGYLRELFIDSDVEDHAFIPAHPGDNPYNPPGFEEGLRKTLPPHLVSRLVDGNWDDLDDETYIFPFSWVKAAMERTMEPEGPGVGGLDVGAGGDETVLAERRGQVITIPYTSQHKNTMRTVGEVARVIDDRDLKWVNVDAVGIGKPIHDRLKEQKYPVHEYISGARALKPDKYFNKKAEDHWVFRMDLEDGVIDLPDDDKLRSQLCSIKLDHLSENKIKVESKKDRASKRQLKSPDRAEAVIYSSAKQKKRRRWEVAA